MKSLLLPILFLCACSLTAGGQNNYVEVSVTDTVQVKADYFVFRINANPEYNAYAATDTTGMRADPAGYYQRNAERQRQRQQEAYKAVEQKLKDAGFALEPQTLADWTFRNANMLNITIATHDINTLAVLDKMIRTEKNMSCNLLQVSSSRENAETERLMQKLMTKARERATQLANKAGKKLLSVISVSDRKGEYPAYMQTSNINLLNTLGIDRTLAGENTTVNPKYPMQNSLVVRFAWQ